MEKKGKICFEWRDKIVGQAGEIQGNVILPFVPFEDSDPKEKKFVPMKLENEFDIEMLKQLEEDGIKWIAFRLSDCIKKR